MTAAEFRDITGTDPGPNEGAFTAADLDDVNRPLGANYRARRTAEQLRSNPAAYKLTRDGQVYTSLDVFGSYCQVVELIADAPRALRVGDRVRLTTETDELTQIGALGTVASVHGGECVGVRFDDRFCDDLHSLDGLAPDRTGYYLPTAAVELVAAAPQPPSAVLSASQKAQLGETLIHLITIGNPQAREMIAAATGVWVPADEREPLNWLAQHMPAPTTTPPRTRRATVDFDFSYTAVERGTCSYSTTNSYSGTFRIDADEFREICEEEDWDGRRVRQRVESLIDRDGDADHCDTGDYDYSDYDQSDSDGREYQEYPGLESIIDEFIGDNQPPEDE